MAAKTPFNGLSAWLVHRLWANFWALPLVAIVGAPLVGAAALWLDRNGATQWMLERGLQVAASPDTAQDAAIALAGIDAALLTLYFSITLIVLTLATGNLGVRLVDRWLDKGMVRLSMSGLAFVMVFTVIVLLAIDPGAGNADLPQFAFAAMLALQLVNLSMLGVAAHDLGRTMFVDRSIAHIGAEAASGTVPIVGGPAHDGAWAFTLRAPREGYVEGADLECLRELLPVSHGTVRICAAPGSHVLQDEPLMLMETKPSVDPDKLLRALPIGEYRSNAQSTVFQVRLLVEVAARALSPGINDFYTAMACADRMALAMDGQSACWVDDGAMPLYADAQHFELPGQDFRGLFEQPLKQLRQAAADYPAVSIRLVENFARLAGRLRKNEGPCGLAAFLRVQAEAIVSHAAQNAEFAEDREEIARSLDQFNSQGVDEWEHAA